MVGRRIRVRAFGGEVLERMVIEEGETFVVVCREEELLAAEKEGRQPNRVGFSKEFVLDAAPEGA